MQYLTMRQLRAKLGNRGRTTIYVDIEKGRLPQPLKIGNKLFWVESQVDAAIAQLAVNQGVQPVAAIAAQ